MANASGSGSGGKSGAIRAGRAFVQLDSEDAGLRSGLEKARKMVLHFGATIAGVGAGIGGIGALITGPILGAMQEAADRFNEVRKAADQLGTSTEVFSGLGYAVQKFGVDSEGLVTASRHLDRFIVAAKDGGAAADTLKELGLSAADLINLPLDEQFKAIAEGISQLGTEAERQTATLEIFGRGAGNLAPLMRKGAAGIQEMLAKAKDVGAIVTAEDAENARRYSAALTQMKGAIHFLVEAVGAAALGTVADQLQSLAEFITPIIKGVRLFIDDNRELVTGVLAVGAAISAAGAAFVVIGGGLALAATAAAGFATVVGAVASVAGTVLAAVVTPVGLIVATAAVAAVMLAALVAETVDLEGAGAALGRVWAGVAETFLTTWAGIKSALASGDLAGAFKIAVLGLDVIWKGAVLGLTIAWNRFKDTVVDGFHDVLTEIRVVVADIVRAVGDSFRTITRQLPDVVRRNLPRETKALLDVLELGSGIASEEQIRAQAAVEGAARRAARANKELAAAMDVVRARAELEGATIDERLKGLDAFANFQFPNGFEGARQAALGALSVAGGFGSNLAAQAFGAGKAVSEKIEKNTRQADEKLGRIEDKVGGIPVE